MPDPNLPVIGKNILNSDKDIFDKVLQKAPNREPFVSQPFSQIPLNRYNYVFYGADNEEMYARAQSGWDQLANGTIKAIGTFTSSLLTGTLGLVNGVGQMISTGRAASFYDNEFTRSLDEWNKSLEDSLPNYYTQAEKDADWYSPTNIFTGNFWGDKVFKNLGYSAGAIVGGMGWGAVLKGVGLTSRLVAAGKGLQAIEATEAAMINAPKLTRLGAINNSLTSAWNGTKGMLGRGLMNTDRALISAFGTTGEASIEALEASNNYRNKLIAEYKDTYGVAPTKEALQEINSYADKVGNNVFAANVALLTATNYIQLPKILGSSKSLEKGAINNINRELVEETVEVAGKKVTRQVEKYVAGTPTTGNILSPIVNKLGKPGRFIDKYVLGPGRLTFSATEAFEEGAQFSIQAGTEDYFDRAYKHEGDVDELLDGVGGVLGNIFTEGVRKTLTSKEGMESILIGGISGGLQKARGNIRERGLFGTSGEVGRNTQLAIDSLNKSNLDKVLKDRKKFLGISIGSQQLRQQAIENDDTFNEKNYEEDYTLSYVMPRVKYGREEAIYQELEGYKQQVMTEGGFEELQGLGYVMPGEKKEKFIQRLDNVRRSTEEVKKVYEHVNNKYSGLVDKEGKVVYTPEVIDKMVYAASKVTNLDQRLKELDAKLFNNNVDTNRIKEKFAANKEFKEKPEEVLKDESVQDEIKTTLNTLQQSTTQEGAIQESSVLEGDDVQKDFTDFTEMLVQRQMYINDYFNLRTTPEKFKEEVKRPLDQQVPPGAETSGEKRKIKIKIKGGEVEFETGTEYFVERLVDKDAKGRPVYKLPVMTVVGENPDGSIKVIVDGVEKNHPREKFLSFNFNEVEKIKNDPKENFYRQNWNVVYKHKGLKDRNGNPREGRLEYSPKKGILLFKYIDERGKDKSVEVASHQFNAQKGYKSAMIEPVVETLTAAQQAAQTTFSESKEDFRFDLQKRRAAVSDIVTNSKKRLEEINKELGKASESMEKLDEALYNATFTKKGLPRKALKNFRRTIEELSKQKEALQKTVDNLQEEKEDIEAQLPYQESLLTEVESLPENYEDAIEDLKDDIASLKEMVENTEQSIKTGESMIENLTNMLKKALSAFDGFITSLRNTLKERYPDQTIPLTMDEYRENLSKFFEEQGADLIISERRGFTEFVTDLEEAVSERQEELNLPSTEQKLKGLQKNVAELKEGLQKLRGELGAKEAMLNALNDLVRQIEEQRAQNELLQKSDDFINMIFGTMDNSQRTMEYSKDFEQDSRKDAITIPSATIASKNLPGYKNANVFGNNFFTFKNRNKIKAILVTSENEEAAGVPGLTKHLAQGRDELPKNNPDYIDPTKTIAVVMVEEQEDGSIRFVGVDGAPIDGAVDATFNNIVYQVMPSEELQWSEEYGGKSMFRKGTPDTVIDSLKKQYATWREGVLNDPPTKTYSIDASFGVPDPVMVMDDKGVLDEDPNPTTSVEDAGLVAQDDILTKPLLYIPTTNNIISKGVTKFRNALGRVFLNLPNAYVKLENRRVTKKEAELLYKVIERVATKVYEDGDVKAEDVQRMLNWLKTVVYWGTPKDSKGNKKAAGYNSIWFERGELTEDGKVKKQLVLNISNKDGKIPFNPNFLRDNKSFVIEALQKLYNNVNATAAVGSKKVNWNDPYEEITDINSDGSLATRTWPSYQSFLLSNKAPNADGALTEVRKEALPVHVRLKPKTSPEDTNRSGVYFILKDVKYSEPKVQPAPKPKAPAPAPVVTPAPTAPISNVEAKKADIERRRKEEINWEKKINDAQSKEDLLKVIEDISGRTSSDMSMGFNATIVVASQLSDSKRIAIQDLKDIEKFFIKQINVKSDAEYIDAVKKGEMTKEQAMQALEEVGRKDSQAYKQLAALEGAKPAAAPGKVTRITPGAGATGVQREGATGIESLKQNPPGVFDLSGKTLNTNVSPQGRTVRWIFKPGKTGIDAIGPIKEDVDRVFSELTEQAKKEGKPAPKLETVVTGIKSNIYNSIPVGALDDSDSLSVPEEDFTEDADFKSSTDDIVVIDEEEDGDGISVSEEEDVVEKQIETVQKQEESDGYSVDNLLNEELDRNDDSHNDLRVALEEENKNFKPENWSEIEKWLKQNFSWLPVYRVKNIIRTTNGLQAWGMLKNGAIYIYENAEIGTIYHEVFEAVKKHFVSPKELKAIEREFKSRQGTFVDRPTGREIAYKDATSYQIKEQLAEEFRDYVLYKKIPPKPADNRPFIVKLFSDIVNFIKNFFVNTPNAKNNTERLFQKIGSGYYNRYAPFENSLSFAKKGVLDIEDAVATEQDELRVALRGQTIHDVMQELTYLTLRKLITDNEDLFEVSSEKVNKADLYRDLKYNLGITTLGRARAAKRLLREKKIDKETAISIIGDGISLWRKINSQWPAIVEKHREYLRSYSIEFDENDELNLRSEENTGRGEFDGADKIDHFRKTNTAVKLLLSTLPMTMDGKIVRSSIGGVKLLPLSKVYMTLMNNLHTSRNLDEMIERVRDLARSDENYERLYYRLTKTPSTETTFSLDDVNNLSDSKLLLSIWTTFKKQNPDVKTVFVFESGEVSVGDSNLASAARKIKSDYETALKVAVRKPKNKYFEYSEKEKAYVGKEDSIAAVKLDSPGAQANFLKELGITFKKEEIEKLSNDKRQAFDDAVGGIRKSIKEADKISTVSGKTLDIEGRLMSLSLIRASLDNPEFDSTFFNVKGERTQSYIGTNAISDLFDALHQINDLNELYGTKYEYILTDSFAQNSTIINRMFNVKRNEEGKIVSGERIQNVPNYLRGAYADGTVNNMTGKKKQSSKQVYKERLIQEVNLNLGGYYLNLVPGDASMEHMVFMGNTISERTLLSGFGRVFDVFKGYFISEVELSREKNRDIVQDSGRTRNKKDLRFFKGILGEELHNEIINDKRALSPQELYNAYKSKIDSAVEKFIKEETNKTKALFEEYGISKREENKVIVDGVGLPLGMTEVEYSRNMNALTINYVINNIELHKLLYSDPYQYKDELKRIKNFLSPRQAILHGSAAMNVSLNKLWNQGYSKDDVAYTNMTRDYFNTVSLKDVLGEAKLEGYEEAGYEETDGSGISSMKANRNFRIRVGSWNPFEEAQYKYDMAWYKRNRAERIAKSGRELTKKEKAKYKLSEEEQILLDGANPAVRSAYTTQKPIVAGNNGTSTNNIILDKFALYPLSYRIAYETAPRDENGNVIETNAMRLFDKMMDEDIDYVVFDTGRKVGAKNSYELYDENGILNPQPFSKKTQVPFSILSVQSEVPSKEDELVTRGSQVTKLVTMDFMEGGVPIDFVDSNGSTEFSIERYEEWYNLTEDQRLAYNNGDNLYKEIKNNQLLLEELIENGYQSLLRRMGIVEEVEANGSKRFKIEDPSKVEQVLREEILKRETNDNIIESLNGYLRGDTILEATPAYRQIKNILYSIADKQVASQKITGGQKVQIPSTLFETNRIAPKTVNGKKIYTSDVLDFYTDEDGKRICELMLSRWFDSPLSDEELLNYFNNTEEGRKQLEGLTSVAFRTPNQKQNSTDRFVIKKFLPKEFGDNVVVPAALVKKAGSDFDIDKLSVYLKNMVVGKDGKPRLIRFLTNENSTVEERYVNWVRENSNRDTRRYVKFLTRSQVENLKVNFEIELAKIRAEVKATIKDMSNISFERMQEEIRAEKQDKLISQDAYMKELFEEGGKLFWSLDEKTLDKFLNLKNEISIKKIKGPDEIRLYLTLAQGILTSNKNLSLGDRTKLPLMINLYKQELQVLGASEKIIQDIVDNALLRFRADKEVDYKDVMDTFSTSFISLDEMYVQAKTEQGLEAAKEIANIDGLKSIEEFAQTSIYAQNTRSALENGYIESMEKLVSHPLNFKQLVKPNSAKQLKELADDINKKLGRKEFDYSNTKNMLSREFMSRLRQAFVSGKYAIGIAAVNQTNHSLNQRQLIYVDNNRLDNVPEEDKFWLGDGLVRFSEYNKMRVGNKTVPVLSMIKNAAGDFISDIIGQFIDGYVDIAKGPWIMELGATPNTASTWLFLMKIGVPAKTVAYFMNQPIIRSYLSEIENSGYSWLFIDQMYENALEAYGNPSIEGIYKIPSEKALGDMVGKSVSQLNAQQRQQQAFILKEFVKYAKMASHMFNVTQGSNFDTSNFNDGALVFKKMEQYKKAQQAILSSYDPSTKSSIPAVDAIVGNSFLKKLANTIYDIRDAYAQILKSDGSNVRAVLEPILRDFIDTNDRDFVKIAQKLVMDLFDWAVQTDRDFNKDIASTLLGKDNSPEKVMEFVNSVKENKKHPLYKNFVIEMLTHSTENDVNNLSLANRDNKVYDQNQIIYAFSEIKEHLESEGNLGLYNQLVLTAVLQSGLSSSKISFTSLLPYDDFREMYNKSLSKLNEIPNLQAFRELGVFYKNNWNNDDIVGQSAARLISYIDGRTGFLQYVYNPAMQFLPKELQTAVQEGKIPQVMSVSELSSEANHEFIAYSWEKPMSEYLSKEEMNSRDSYKIWNAKKLEMRKRGDYSYMNKGLFRRVYDGTDPLSYPYTNAKGITRRYQVYKMVNAWGDSFRANEFYDVAKQSVIDNGFIKTKEVSDEIVRNAFYGKDLAKTVKKSGKQPTTPVVSEGAVSKPSKKSKIKPEGYPEIKQTNKNRCG